MPIYSEAKALGLEIDHHESDLYIKVSPEATKLANKYSDIPNSSTFISQIDGKLWYEFPFQFTPFWEGKPCV